MQCAIMDVNTRIILIVSDWEVEPCWAVFLPWCACTLQMLQLAPTAVTPLSTSTSTAQQTCPISTSQRTAPSAALPTSSHLSHQVRDIYTFLEAGDSASIAHSVIGTSNSLWRHWVCKDFRMITCQQSSSQCSLACQVAGHTGMVALICTWSH